MDTVPHTIAKTGYRFAGIRLFLQLLGVPLAVALASWLGLSITREHGHISTLWLANGVVLGVILTIPVKEWAGIILSAFMANAAVAIGYGDNPLLAIALALCNSIEILAAGLLIYRPENLVHNFTDRSTVWRMAWGFAVAPLLSAIAAAAALAELDHSSIVSAFNVRYLADALGLALVTPLVLSIRRGDVLALCRRDQMGIIFSLSCLIIVTVAVFAQTRYPLLFVIFPPLLLVVFRVGFVGMTLSLFWIAVAAIGFTLIGHGPFMLIQNTSLAGRIFTLQLFLLTVMVMAIPAAVVLAERRRLEQKLLTAQEQLQQLAATDQLTGIANRRMFEGFMDREWKRAIRDAAPLSAILIDVDWFKSYNDRYGHPAGDKCLMAVASCLAETLKRPGDLVARYGGEEFIVLLPGTENGGACFVAEQIRRRIESLQLVHAGSSYGRITVSLGVATVLPIKDDAFDQLIAAADGALYAAKHAGRNRLMRAGEAKVAMAVHS